MAAHLNQIRIHYLCLHRPLRSNWYWMFSIMTSSDYFHLLTKTEKWGKIEQPQICKLKRPLLVSNIFAWLSVVCCLLVLPMSLHINWCPLFTKHTVLNRAFWKKEKKCIKGKPLLKKKCNKCYHRGGGSPILSIVEISPKQAFLPIYFLLQNMPKHARRIKEVHCRVYRVTNIFPLISRNLWLAGRKFSESWLV